MREENGRVSYFGQDSYYYPWREAMAVVIAEKSAHSTWTRTPIQFEYRDTIKFEDRNGSREIVRQTIPANAADPYVAAALRFYHSKRPPFLMPTEKVAIPDKFLHYSPETVYCGSLFPIEQHLNTKERSRA
jgi:hypothetical protein